VAVNEDCLPTTEIVADVMTKRLPGVRRWHEHANATR
jgi:hypothetical protein